MAEATSESHKRWTLDIRRTTSLCLERSSPHDHLSSVDEPLTDINVDTSTSRLSCVVSGATCSILEDIPRLVSAQLELRRQIQNRHLNLATRDRHVFALDQRERRLRQHRTNSERRESVCLYSKMAKQHLAGTVFKQTYFSFDPN
eukprot:6196345-Pleurochrysis_carterae.AAC.1